MRYGLSVVLALAWALWLGGIICLFIVVSDLFKIDRTTAIVAAPRMFFQLQKFELLFAAVALLSAAGLRLKEPRAALNALFALLAVATIGLVIMAAVIMPKLEKLRLAGESSGPQFRAVHGQSMALHTLQAAALLGAGMCLPFAMSSRPSPPRETAPAAADPTAPPA